MGLLIVLLALIGVLAWAPWAINRWRFRHIPGPFAPPVLGNLLGLAEYDLHGYLDLCKRRYGKLFKIYIGSNMGVCIADATVAKRVFSKQMHRHTGMQLTTGEGDWDLLVDGLVGTNGDAWRRIRSAWTPAFSPTALESYASVMNSGADALIQKLAAAAGSGTEVELFSDLMAMTLDVVGQAAYGVKFHALEQQQQQQQPNDLLDCVQAIFEGGGVTNSSNYLPLVLLFPWLGRAVQWAAYQWPDHKLIKLSMARKHIRQLSLQLLHSWRHQKPNSQQQQQQMDSSSSSSSSSTDPSNGAEAAEKTKLITAGPGIFQQSLLNAVDKETGQKLSDEQVIAQFNTFLITSYETTASTILYCIYFLAQHAHIQQRLLAEIDNFGNHNNKVSYNDLNKFPYTDAVIKETLRLMPAGAVASRFTQQPLQLTDKVMLPAGTPLFGCIQCIQRDPDYWPAAEDFKPERWLPEGAALQCSNPDAYVPFGFGPRQCVGKKFAEQEVLIVLIRLYQQYTFELLQPDKQVPLPTKHTFGVVPSQGLRVRVHKR